MRLFSYISAMSKRAVRPYFPEWAISMLPMPARFPKDSEFHRRKVALLFSSRCCQMAILIIMLCMEVRFEGMLYEVDHKILLRLPSDHRSEMGSKLLVSCSRSTA